MLKLGNASITLSFKVESSVNTRHRKAKLEGQKLGRDVSADLMLDITSTNGKRRHTPTDRLETKPQRYQP